MNIRSCAYVLTAVFLSPLLGCSTTSSQAADKAPAVVYSPKLEPDKSFAELKQDMENGLRDVGRFVSRNKDGGLSYTFLRKSVEMIRVGDDDMSVNFNEATLFGGTDKNDVEFTFHIYYSDLGNKPLSAEACKADRIILPYSGKIDWIEVFDDPKAHAFCDTLYNLGLRYKEQQAEEQAKFLEQAARYRTLSEKPTLSEEQRRFIVQAEACRKRKDYAEAIRVFREAVKLDPVSYPAAYLNMALLYAEQQRYQMAIDTMQKYLALGPDAKDARSAQDKIYEWEAMMQK